MRRQGLATAVGMALIVASAAAGTVGYGARPAHAATPGEFPVSVTSSTFVDASRPTPARQGVAAQSTRTIHELIYTPRGPSGPLPTVVFAPGWDSQSSGYEPLLLAMASAGYVVIGVDSPGSSSYFPGQPYNSAAGEDIANNTLDLSAALENAEKGSAAGRVNPLEVAAVGHSDGGSVVANLALNADFTTDAFTAYVVLSGDIPTGMVPGSFAARNNGPIMAMVGTDDQFGNYTPDGGDGTESVYATAGPSKLMVSIAGADHLSAYTGTGAQADDTRAAIVDFLDTADTHDAGYAPALDQSLRRDGLSAQQDLDAGWALTPEAVGMAATADGGGYWVVWNDGLVRPFGDAADFGRVYPLGSPLTAVAGTSSGHGYWVSDAAGEVFSFGDAVYHGGLGATRLAAPIVAMAGDPATGGYWLLGGDGGVFSFDAPFLGSTGNLHLAAPAVGMAGAADGHGYWFAATDGGIFGYGSAPFRGSMGGRPLNRPVVGMAADHRSSGYWSVASDGGVFSFDAPFEGSTGAVSLSRPVVSMTADPVGGGYWLLAADGGIFAFGSAPFEGSGG